MNNKRTTKRTLALSLLVMLMCVAMLVGTTFAWFTDSATSSGNKIQAGRLHIDLLVKKDVSTNPDSVEYVSVKEDHAAIFNYDKWEPGYTEVRNVKVSTTGNLALKYTLKIVPQSTTADALKLAEVIDVYYASSEVIVTGRDLTGLTGLTRIGTLKDVLNGAEGTVISDTLIPGENSEDFATIVLKMQESAGNDYQGLSVGEGFDLNLVATQYTYEEDSFDNQYDANAGYPVTTTADLASAIADAEAGSVVTLASGNYTLPAIPEGVTIAGNSKTGSVLQSENSSINKNDVTIKNLTVQGSGANGTSGSMNISGNNTTIENVNYTGEAGKIAIAVSTGNDNSGTVFKDTKITNAFRGIQFWRLSGNSVIDSCVLDVPGYTFNIDAVASGATLTVKDSTLNGWTSYTSGIQLVSFENCKFGLNTYEYLRPYSETELTNCEFTSEDYQLNAGGSGAYTITLTNCTKNGTAITAENVVSLLLDTDGWNSNVTLIVNGVTVVV